MKDVFTYKYNFIALLFLINISYSQSNYQVEYKMTTLFDGVKNYDAKLSFSELKSCFEYRLSLKDTASIDTQDENGNFNISIPEKRQQAVLNDIKEKRISEIKYLKKAYLVEDTFVFPKWEIYTETKTINNYLCQKATTFYKGRRYEAWFTIEFPTIFGPWKLNGLPGLIIIAQDEKNEVFFEAIEIKKTENSRCHEDYPFTIISRLDYDILMEKKLKEFEERLKAMGNRDSKINVKFGKVDGIEIIN
ncbi:GLPGLI family protein [Flavobacterium sp.]|uniref:GLPGLI family protein n=1 Tax=Flavobacterium sp. TaxID=239 RepID=UPI003752815A